MNGTYYAFLLDELRDSIRAKRPGKLTNGIRLLHDNAPVHLTLFYKLPFANVAFRKEKLKARRFKDESELQAGVIVYSDGKLHFHTRFIN